MVQSKTNKRWRPKALREAILAEYAQGAYADEIVTKYAGQGITRQYVWQLVSRKNIRSTSLPKRNRKISQISQNSLTAALAAVARLKQIKVDEEEG